MNSLIDVKFLHKQGFENLLLFLFSTGINMCVNSK